MTTLHDIAITARLGAGWLQPLRRPFRRIVGIPATPFIFLWCRLRAANLRRRAERDLRSLSDATLRDIGIARSDISRIAAAPSEQWRGGRDGAR
ncbi:MAG: DUF1127 domain-containing protein [Acidobacteriota bacterium]